MSSVMQREQVANVLIPAGAVTLEGRLEIPGGARGVVVFIHGSGSGRHSPRNQRVAAALEAHGVGTLLLGLLTPAEEVRDHADGGLRFDIDLLTGRVVAVLEWLHRSPPTRSLALGLFGASTGAAAALVAAARRPELVAAVVSRGGRPDLAGPRLPDVLAPTLLIVGGADLGVLGLNRAALRQLAGPKDLVVLPGATHLFEEAGALEAVAELAVDWFSRHLAPAREVTASAG